MLKKLGIGLALLAMLVFCFAGFVALQPNEFKVTRSATMAAPPAVVFAQVNDFHAWQDWSPWAKLDPNATATFEGPDAGPGAKFLWAGNDEVGEGSMTITESKPAERILIKLAFTKPYQDASDVEFTFKPDGDQTNVSWTMSGQHTFMSKAMCLFMNMDKMVGEKFEEGLASIKAKVETPKTATP